MDVDAERRHGGPDARCLGLLGGAFAAGRLGLVHVAPRGRGVRRPYPQQNDRHPPVRCSALRSQTTWPPSSERRSGVHRVPAAGPRRATHVSAGPGPASGGHDRLARPVPRLRDSPADQPARRRAGARRLARRPPRPSRGRRRRTSRAADPRSARAWGGDPPCTAAAAAAPRLPHRQPEAVEPPRADPVGRRPERASDAGLGSGRSCSCSTPAATTLPTPATDSGGSCTAQPAPTSPSCSGSPAPSTPDPSAPGCPAP